MIMKDAAIEARDHLRQAQEEILVISLPLRESRDELVRAGMDDEAEKLSHRIKEVESGLFGIQNAIGALNIALGGFVLNAEPAEYGHIFRI